jgi:hypothetical protein
MAQSDLSTPYPDEETKAIVVVLTDFVKVHQVLLNSFSPSHSARMGNVLM